MICRLCLNHVEQGFNLFEDDKKKGAAFLIGKHFWFEVIKPKLDDGFSHSVCWNCWNNICSFNSFFIQIEKAHQIFFENITEIKSETAEVPKNRFNDFEKRVIGKIYSNREFDISESVETIVKEEVFFDESSAICNIADLNQTNEILSLNNWIEDDDLKLNIEKQSKLIGIKSKTSKCRLQSKSQGNEKQIRKRKSPEEITALNKKLADEDKIIATFMKVFCNVCMSEQKTFSSLKKHCTLEHKQKGFVICCEKKYFKRFLLVDHIEKHLNPESYKCSFCEKNFTSRFTLRDHIRFIHKNVENNIFFKCSLCEKSFTNKNLMIRHELFHIPVEERQFKCVSCEKAFPSKATLDCHIRKEHEKRYAGICDICGKSYKNKADLKRHRWEQHEGEDKPKIQCKFCNLQFLSRYTYQLHKNNDHKNQNVEQKCSTCEKTFPNNEALRSHIRYTHNAKAKFQCHICEKNFKRQLVLKEHMAVHTGQQLYVCPHCPKTFTHSSNMHHHRKRVHPKEFEEARQMQNEKKESWCKKTALKT